MFPGCMKQEHLLSQVRQEECLVCDVQLLFKTTKSSRSPNTASESLIQRRMSLKKPSARRWKAPHKQSCLIRDITCVFYIDSLYYNIFSTERTHPCLTTKGASEGIHFIFNIKTNYIEHVKKTKQGDHVSLACLPM